MASQTRMQTALRTLREAASKVESEARHVPDEGVPMDVAGGEWRPVSVSLVSKDRAPVPFNRELLS